MALMSGLPLRDWRWLTLLLCLYGFWSEIRPVTPFLTPFLASRNLTHEQLYGEVFPVWTYSALVFLVPVFILTDLLRCKAMLLSACLAYVVTWLLLIYARSLRLMQLMQVCFGWACSAEVAYYAYIYSVVEARHYQKATSAVHAAALIGKCVAYGLAQLLVSTGTASLMDLNYITLGAMLLIVVFAALLPNNKLQPNYSSSRDLERQTHKLQVKAGDEDEEEEEEGFSVSVYFATLFAKFCRCYKDPFTLKWSIWWALGTCGYYQVASYVQTLYDEWLEETGTSGLYNGLVDATATLVGAATAMGTGWMSLAWAEVGELILGLTALAQGALLILAARTQRLLFAYLSYVAFYVLYQTLKTVATFNVAKRIEKDSYGLVFGWNTLMTLIAQTILTAVVTDSAGLNLPIRPQFIVYGGWHGALGLAFLVSSLFTVYRLRCQCKCRAASTNSTEDSELKLSEET